MNPNMNATAQMVTHGQIKYKQPRREPVRSSKQMEMVIVKEIAHKEHMTHGQLVEHIIRLYGLELDKANTEIMRLRSGIMCPRCEERFLPKSHNQRYCSYKCKGEARAEAKRKKLTA